LNFFSFPLLLFRSLFLSLEFVRLSHSLINTVLLLLCYCVTVTIVKNSREPQQLSAKSRQKVESTLNVSVVSLYDNFCRLSKGSNNIATEATKNTAFRHVAVIWRRFCREPSQISSQVLYRQKLESPCYIFVADVMGLSSFSSTPKSRQKNPVKPTQETDFSTNLNVI